MNQAEPTFQMVEVDEGDTIFAEGEEGHDAYIIMNGRVKIYRTINKKRIVMARLGPGQIIGEMAIISGEPRTAAAEALEPCKLAQISEEGLQNALTQNLSIVKTLIDQLTGRLKKLLNQQPSAIDNLQRLELLEKSLKIIKQAADGCDQEEVTDGGMKKLLDTIDDVYQKNGPWF